jgi:6-phosphofructokinase 1
MEQFLEDTNRIYKANGKVIIAVSEGCKDANGKYVAEMGDNLAKDSFGHAQLGGTASILANIVKSKIAKKVRGIEFSLLQRAAAHVGSLTDVNEAYLAGQMAVKYAVEGKTDYMVAFERAEGPEYKCNIKLLNLTEVANTEKKIPREWINKEGNFVTEDFI